LLVTVIWGQAQTPAAAQAASQWKDGEYPLYEAYTKAPDNAKKLDALKAWEAKFPDSALKATRLQLFLNVYQALKQLDKIMETGNEIIASDPKNIPALWALTSTIQMIEKPTPEQLAIGEKGAQAFATKYDDLKPAAVPDAEWAKEKPTFQSAAYVALGLIAQQRKDNAAAEKAYLQSLQVNPNNAQVSYTIGVLILGQRNPDTYSIGLYHIARAATLTGAGEMPAANRTKVDSYLTSTYTKYHGSAEGLDEVKKLASASAIPPASGFMIKSAAQITIEKEEEFKASNPMLALFKSVQDALKGPTGTQYFESSVKGAGLPKFKGKLVEAVPAKNPKQLKIAISNDDTAEVTLVFEEALTGSAPKGTELEFEGIGASFVAEPFNLTMDVEKDKLVGWPVQAPAGKKNITPAKPAGTSAAKPPVAPAAAKPAATPAATKK